MVERGRARRHCVRGARARAVGRAGVRARRFRRAQLVRRGPRGLAVVRRRRALEGTGLLAADKAQHDHAAIQDIYSEVALRSAGWRQVRADGLARPRPRGRRSDARRPRYVQIETPESLTLTMTFFLV